MLDAQSLLAAPAVSFLRGQQGAAVVSFPLKGIGTCARLIAL